ncbi:MAG: hypothetical protein Phog2KO_28060 [Phototrophicaceae bacterium]
MQKKMSFKFRVLAILILAVFLVVPMIAVSAQDDDDYYDDDYYDDYYDDDYYDDYYDDDYYDDDYYDDDYYDDDYDDYYDDDYYDDYGSEDVIASYEIDDLDLLGNPDGDHIDLWDSFTAVIPREYLDRFVMFEVIDDEDTTGYVYIDDNDDESYVLGLSLTLLDEPDETIHTTIHEFGHTVTLNYEQVDGTLARGATCPTFELEEGCSEENSYIFAFYSAFYDGGEDTSSSAFVTDYASENIAEDMAESFTFFVMEDEERDGNTVADQKVNFFYNFPELVEMREAIRENLDD